MSTSTSNLPAIIVAVVVLALLAVFYVADRSSGGPDMAAITHSADTEQMISSKKKYESKKSVFSHSGYSGSLDGYLEHAGHHSANKEVLKEHQGYSGSGKEYVEHQKAKVDAMQQHSAGEHSGYSGSIDDYLAGNYDQRQSHKKQKPESAPSHKAEKKHSSDTNTSDQGYSGSVDQYLKKYGG